MTTPNDLPGFTGNLSAERFPMYGVTGRGPFLVTVETRRKEAGYEGMRSEGRQVEVDRARTMKGAVALMIDFNARVVAHLSTPADAAEFSRLARA
jgi:hypothetical protein